MSISDKKTESQPISNSEIKAVAERLKKTNEEIKSLATQMKKLRDEKKGLEALVSSYLEKTNKQGVRLKDFIFSLKPTKVSIRMKKADKVAAVSECLANMGIEDSDEAAKKVMEKMQGEKTDVVKLKTSKFIEEL